MRTESINEYISCLEQKDFNEIKELIVKKLSITKELLEVDLNELLLFPNLERLTISDMTINYEDFNIISHINLTNLHLINCDLPDMVEDLINIDELTLTNTYLYIDKLSNVNKLILKNIDTSIKEINCKYLDISKSIIRNIDNLNVEIICLSEEQYEVYKDKLNAIKIIIKDKYDTIVGEI